MKGMPANITTTMATNTRFSMRAAEQHALVAFVGTLRTGLQPFLHDDGDKGSANTPLATSTAQMPLWTIHDTSVR
jgi:hypothetical protein